MAPELLELFDHPHPLLAASATKVLGGLLSRESLDLGPGLPSLDTLLARLARHPVRPKSLCGTFLDRPNMDGLSILSRNVGLVASGFDLGEWGLTVLDADADPHDDGDLPHIQPFWFPVHEFYCFDPGFVERLTRHRHPWVALMCATEMLEKV